MKVTLLSWNFNYVKNLARWEFTVSTEVKKFFRVKKQIITAYLEPDSRLFWINTSNGKTLERRLDLALDNIYFNLEQYPSLRNKKVLSTAQERNDWMHLQ